MSRPLVAGLIAEGETDELFLGRVISRQLRALADRSARCRIDIEPVEYGSWRMIKDDARIHAAAMELAADCHIVFLHNDHREREKAERLARALQDAGVDRSVIPLVPVRETEAWLLADGSVWAAVPGADPGRLPARPRDVEKIADPKRVLREVLARVSHREVRDHFAFAGDRVDLDVLGRVPAYAEWVAATTRALVDQGFL
ncbi:DUF4276 family protein [Spongiactinospora sp. 9N601]|uniref:DUF4276 family protein n=1 Tax=Spongiactinospora sp. 9N601 TaxID=3375149 RepID=UPI00379F6B53